LNVNKFSLRFLGVSNSVDSPLGCSAAVLEQAGIPLLLIDCGPGTVRRYRDHYQQWPEAIYLTHGHWDHVGDLEPLFYASYFAEPRRLVKLYVPAPAVPFIHQRLASQPSQLAEGGANFWDAFQLIPVQDSFWHAGLQFNLYAMRHHQPNFCHSLHLPGQFFYSADTRPVPEIIQHCCINSEVIFHDARLHGNPSHSGIEDVVHEYEADFCRRMVIYHYLEGEEPALREKGFVLAEPAQQFVLPKS
jgi:ribonuclease BN (tRNA processing enzyme)